MARSSGNSLLNTLRGKIWISTSVLAFFICIFGLISYLVVTLLTSNPFYGVFIPFLLLAFSVIVFGWWLSNELIKPIDNVILLSKSMERNSSTTLPKTSGSAETDQLLVSLHKNSQQLQGVITLMDKIANGNVNVSLSPLKSSDRLTSTFQKLLNVYSESIHAKDELIELKAELESLKKEIAGVDNGELNVEIQDDYYHTKEISETIKYLIENLTLLITIIKVDSNQAATSANEIEDSLVNLVKQDEENIQKMNHASLTLKQVPNLINKITSDLNRSAQSARQTIDKTRQGAEISQANSESVSKLRSNLRESINRIHSLNERSHEIGKVAKMVDDLASRTNMIALNASIQATELGEDGHRFVLISEELERLATRADGTNKQISMLNNTILSEIGRVENSLETTLGGVAGLSKYTIETGNVLGELERYIGQFLNLQDNLISFSNDQSEETNEAFETVIKSISDSESKIKELANSSELTKRINLLMKNLQSHSDEFKVTPKIEQSARNMAVNDLINSQINTIEPLESDLESDSIDESADQAFNTDEYERVKLSTEEFKVMTKPMTDESQEAIESVDAEAQNSLSSETDMTDELIAGLSNVPSYDQSDSEEYYSEDSNAEVDDDAYMIDENDLNDFNVNDYDTRGIEANDEVQHLDSSDASNEFDSLEVADEKVSPSDSHQFENEQNYHPADEIDPEAFIEASMNADQANADDFNSTEFGSNDLDSANFNSEEFLEDDPDINMDKVENSDIQSPPAEKGSQFDNNSDDELINLDQSQNQNPELPA